MSAEKIQRGACDDCGRPDPLTDDGVCAFCAGADEDAVQALRETFEEVVDNHDLPTAFWSLDQLYDEQDGQMSDWGQSQ